MKVGKLVLLGFAGSLAMYANAASILYAHDPSVDQLFEINTTTGEATSVGAYGANVGGGGLAFDPNTLTLFLADTFSDTLYTVSTLTGALTAIGPTGADSIGGIAFDPNSNTLYGYNNKSDELLTINTSTGAATPVGAFGADVGGVGMTFDPLTDTLYLGDGGPTDSLYTIDTSTGVGTAVGPFGVAGMYALAFDPATSTLVGVSNGDDTLYEINASTGVAMSVGLLVNAGGVNGIAFVPEPATLGLLGLVTGGIYFARRFFVA